MPDVQPDPPPEASTPVLEAAPAEPTTHPLVKANQILQYWYEWRKKCDSGLCGDEAKAYLARFGQDRFASNAKRLRNELGWVMETPMSTVSNPSGPDLTAFALLEEHILTGKRRDGKTYKEWLFEPPNKGTQLDVIQGRATLLMRNVVRERAKDYPDPEIGSLDEAVSEGGLTLKEILPAQVAEENEVEMRELDDPSKKLADEFFVQLNRCQKVALLALSLNVSRAAPAVLRAANANRHAVYEATYDAGIELGQFILGRYPGHHRETLRYLILLTLRHLLSKCQEWGGKPENGCEEIFLL